MALTDQLNLRYRQRLADLKATVRQRVTALYGETVTADDLDASFATFIPQAAGLVQAGQSAGVVLASAYLETSVALAAGRQADLAAFSDTGVVGVNAEGAPLAESMAAMPAMVKGQIGEGRPLNEAMQFGSYLAERFADAEVTSAVDLHTEAVVQRSGEFRGWRGVLAGTCDRCRTKNSGEHSLDTPIYRHPHCRCSKEFLVEGTAPRYVSFDEMPDDVRAAYNEADEEFDPKNGDERLSVLTDAQGFTSKPQVMTDADLDRFVADGEIEFWRGVTKESYADSWLYGDGLRHGAGYYGNGTYAAVGRGVIPPAWRAQQGYVSFEAREVAQMFASDGGTVMRGTLRSGSRVLTVSGQPGLNYVDIEDVFDNLTSAERAMDSITHVAASRGYDAVLVQGFGRVGTELGGDQLIVLNRGATRMSSTFTSGRRTADVVSDARERA